MNLLAAAISLLFTGGRYDLEQQAWVVIADARAAAH